MTLTARRTRLVAVVAGLVAVVAIAVPVLGGAMGPATAPAAAPAAESEKPGNGPKTEKPGKGPKEPKAERPAQTPVTRTGRIDTSTGADGDTGYTLTVGSTVYDLDAGPPWWWGESHPLKGLVGETATIEGEQAEGSTSIDVRVVNGTEIRAAGRPPWAGGWKVVGDKHPGWTQAKADRAAEKANRESGRPPWAGPNPPPEPAP